MKKNEASLNESELRDLEWWCRYHKMSANYLAIRIIEYFENPDNSLEGVLKVSAKNVLKENKN
jgi:hypothetical protein